LLVALNNLLQFLYVCGVSRKFLQYCGSGSKKAKTGKKEIKGFEKLDVLSELLGFPVWMCFLKVLMFFFILKTLMTVNFKQI
jgi:hypothetical protein